MTRDDIVRMAREAGYQHPDAVGICEDFAYFDLYRFAALIAAAEREACAKVCDVTIPGDEYLTAVINSYADSIRARGQA